LSMHDGELSATARQWLDRVIERIGTMARAHDLFSGGIEHVDLPRLVEQVLPSLSVIGPPGVRVRTELGDTNLRFATPQAVSLAMVLHELCSNALIHGASEGSSIIVRASVQDDRAVIEVLDEGKSDAVTETSKIAQSQATSGNLAMAVLQTFGVDAAARRGGLGLRLVQELVRRELRGHFELHPREEGGMVARIELPLVQRNVEGEMT